MCGRLSESISYADWEQIGKLYGVVRVPDETHRYNVAPTQLVPLMYEDGGVKVIEQAFWGYLPKGKFSTINVRAETIDERQLYRTAFQDRRGVVIADSFYEWDKSERPSIPFRVMREDAEPIFIAALYARWSEDPPLTCTIVTTAANSLMKSIHERMPVVLDAAEVEAWLDSDTPPAILKKLIAPQPWANMKAYEISRLVNSPRNDVQDVWNPM